MRPARYIGLVVLLLGFAPFSRAQADDRNGVAAGSLQLYPGLRLEIGLDNNPLFEASEKEPRATGVVLINPYVGVRTPEPRMLELNGALGASWEQFTATESSSSTQAGPSGQSGLDIEAGIGVRVNPNGVISVAPSNTLTWATQPNLSVTGDPYRTLNNRFDIELGLHPGGHNRDARLGLSGELGFTHRTWRYDQLAEFDHSGVGGRLELQWNFLPKTAVFLNSMIEKIAYEQAQTVATSITGTSMVDNSDSLAGRVSMGFTGLLTRRLSVLASGGYGHANYAQGQDESTYLTHVDLGLHLSNNGQIHAGWEHNFEDALLSSFVTYHRVYLSGAATAGGLNIGLSAFVHFNDFSTPTNAGTDVDIYNGARQDTVIGGLVDLSYSVTEWFTLGARYTPSVRDSTATFSDASGAAFSADYVQQRAFFYIDLAVVRPVPLAGVSGSASSALGR